jgi:hypothetical protein
MGFLSAWDSNEHVDVSELAGDLPGTWWVEVKKCLNHAEADEITRRLMAETIKMGKPDDKGGVAIETTLSMDAVTDQQEAILVRSIVSWNLTDKDGNVLPFEKDDSLDNPYENLERSLKILPASVYDAINKVVVANNTVKKEESATFPDGGDGEHKDGLDYKRNAGEILV